MMAQITSCIFYRNVYSGHLTLDNYRLLVV